MGEPAKELHLGDRPVHYPESDGQPMAETDLHRNEMMEVIQALELRYAQDSNVYVAGNLLVYYEEGNPAARFAPDAFVVFGVEKRRRRTYKLWEERQSPAFVLEVSSRGTRQEDLVTKLALCAELGVKEYFLYDPEAEYLDPPLQGRRLEKGRYVQLAADAEGRLASQLLGLDLSLDERGLLRLVDQATGKPLLRIAEHAARATRENARAEQEKARAEQEKARADAAEAELARLRALLASK